MTTTTKKTVLITGCSSGIGKLTAKTFYDRGFNVVATMRSPEKERELTALEGMAVLPLDVTRATSIEAAVVEAHARFGGIDVLVNNAGYGGHALLEQMADTAVRAMYETNVFGLMAVTRTVLPIMRRHKEGTIINVSSMAGMLAAPLISVYASTKFAVMGLTEGLAYECKPLNIKVKSVAPGAYPTTRFNANTDDDLETGGPELVSHAARLHAHLRAVAEQMGTLQGKEADPQEVADRIYVCATEDTPVHNPVGHDAEMLAEMIATASSRQVFLDKLEEMVLPRD